MDFLNYRISILLLLVKKGRSDGKGVSVCVLVSQSHPALCNPWTVAGQTSLSMEFSRQENWSGLPFPSPGDLPDLGVEPESPTLQAASLPSEPPISVNLRKCHCAPRFKEREPTPSTLVRVHQDLRGSFNYIFKTMNHLFKLCNFRQYSNPRLGLLL